ncbi:hypothetical protein M011DRAFT_464591 [Sporormia fimetaria CBS 119925]|uniref:MGS207 protein n=1 Tax=Sporormia fimetaria CBS 119925 TaxID=1340428 RepID=A0A6A6VM29_9PLEO|nr:hypothetical protein M011DRAFT_464591 [Sporormia fimetaria CBS 119925]
MFQLPSLFKSFRSSDAPVGEHASIDLPSVEIHDVETAAERRPRTLKHLLKANHVNHALIYHDLRFHNHTAHILGSAYLLGATHEHLNEVYDKEAEELEPWRDAPAEVTREDWREFLGRREYQRAFVDFFEDQLVSMRYDWKQLLREYMFEGKEPLVNGLISGLAHPMIHLGYAYELDSRTLAIEALTGASCFYSPLHKYIDDLSYVRRPTPIEKTTDLLAILSKVRNDKRFDNLYDHQSGDISLVFAKAEDALLEYWNAWDLSGTSTALKNVFEESQRLAAALLVATPNPGKGRFDFFFVHLLTSSHAVRILLPIVPKKHHVGLLRQWWLFALAVFVARLRPSVDMEVVEGYKAEGKGWRDVVHGALKGEHALDAHFVKAVRAFKVAEETWGKKEGLWEKAALKFVREFEGWGGFGGKGVEGKKFGYPEERY